MDNAIEKLEEMAPSEAAVFRRLSNIEASFVLCIIVGDMTPEQACSSLGLRRNSTLSAVSLVSSSKVQDAVSALMNDRTRVYGRVIAHKQLIAALETKETTNQAHRTRIAAAKVVLEHCDVLDKRIESKAKEKPADEMDEEELQELINKSKHIVDTYAVTDVTPPSKDDLLD